MPSLNGVVNRLTQMSPSWLVALPGMIIVAVSALVVTSAHSAYAGTCNNGYGYGANYANYNNYGGRYCGNNYNVRPYANNYYNVGRPYYPVQSAGYCQYGNNCYGGGNNYYGNNYGCGNGGVGCGGYGGYGGYGIQQPIANQAGADSQAGSSSSVNNSGNSQNTNTNNPTATATANVVINPASTVARPSTVSTAGYGPRPSMPMPSQIMLPETGTMDPILRFFGLGGLVAATTGYAISRRELMRSVFKRD